ncbi:EmrB/QacA subfamily drug resistance transporter [Diaminobutyricimonas aerilata]|uniref:EmrB/QacA subfamily drug resistance transporter n=1 Tax=Diaminobutyricimonas aerilata TaxID=1162967 RepID=A0A2M9CIG5_9MICO|nr:MFS transporter [Diaminobutyricimonas aerilata]PJJ71701.1 EmrB/QacA subfamily drug resistance transporter [Diaminobutyricimonas aerilata]
MSHYVSQPPNPLRHRWGILWLVGVAQLMLIVDVTVVAIALPHIGDDLGLDRQALTWVVSGYTLAFGGLLLVGGRIVDLMGARRVVLAALTAFVLASLAAGFADSGTVLLTARVAQGVSAAFLSPAALSVVVTTFDGDERNRALGIWSALGGAGAALGALLGGLLAGGPGWPWMFFMNIPVGVVLVVALQRLLPRIPRGAAAGRIDVLGAVLVTAGTGLLTFALIRAGDAGWLDAVVLWCASGAVVLYVAFTARQLTARVPLMQVRMLARRPVATGTALIAAATALMVMMLFLGTFYLQEDEGLGALVTGLLFLPVAVATMVGAQVAGRVLGKAGARALGTAGMLIAAVGMLVAALGGGVAVVVAGVSIAAAGTGVAFVVASATALGVVAPEEAGIASGIVSTFHEFGATIGAALVSSVAAASILGAGDGGFGRGYLTAAVVALAVAVFVVVAAPRRP